MVRCLIGVLILFSTSAAFADPVLLLLLRMARDKAMSASVEAGVESMQQKSNIPTPVYGFALPTPPIPRGTEEQQVRTLLDENFLHLTAAQRDEVFAGLQKILKDPQYARDRARLVAEFGLTARAVRDSYRGLDTLSYAEKRSLAAQAKEEYRRLPAGERQQLIEVLQSGMLPVPRDLRDIMLAEFKSISPAGGGERRRE
jgi:hypothetical protein